MTDIAHILFDSFASALLPGTLGDKVIDCKHPGVVVMGFSIIFASNL